MYHMIRESYPVYVIAGIMSIALSLWICGNAYIVNPDAVCYLQSAETMQQGIGATLHLCEQSKWPFYSLLIAILAKITTLSYLNSAYILNGFFSLLAVLVFVTIVNVLANSSEVRKNTRLLWLAALVILFAHEFNSVKSSIVRDHGFWAFYLISILMLLQFFRYQSWRYAIGWSASIIIATLFRIEGAVFLFCLPWIGLLNITSTTKGMQHVNATAQKIKWFLQLNAVTLVTGACLAIWFILHPEKSTGRLNELYFQLVHGIDLLVSKFHVSADHLANYVLSTYASHDASIILFIMLIFWYLFSVIRNLSVVYAVLVGYAWCKNIFNIDKSMLKVLWGYIVVNMVVTLVYLFEHMFLSSRYLVALTLTLMLWIPFVLEYLLQNGTHKKLLVAGIFVMIFVSSLGGIFEFGHSKRYIRDAGVWLAENTPQDVKIYSNDAMVLYYSQRFGNNIFAARKAFSHINVLANEKWKQYDYLAIRLRKKPSEQEVEILQELNRNPYRVFNSRHGEQVQIYQIVENTL